MPDPNDEKFMQMAIDEAMDGLKKGDQPFGATPLKVDLKLGPTWGDLE